MSFLRHHIAIIIGAALVSIGVISYAMWGYATQSAFTFTTVTPMTIQEEVHADGTVQAAEVVNLAFERGGTIRAVYAQAGDEVHAGMPLIALDISELSAEQAAAQAAMDTQHAKLEELIGGARPEDIQADNLKVSTALTTLTNAQDTLSNTLHDAYTAADDAIRNKSDQLFSNPRSSSPQFIFIPDEQLTIDIQLARVGIETMLTAWDHSPSPETTFVTNNLQQISSFLTNEARAVNYLLPTKEMPQSTIDAYKLAIFGARTAIDTALTNVSSAEQAVTLAQKMLAEAQHNVISLKAGATAKQIEAQRAQYDLAKANLDLVNAELNTMTLRSPLTGIVSTQDAQVGALATPNTPLVSVISSTQYQVELFVPETDIAKLQQGQTAYVSLDAYGIHDDFKASVIHIDPASTLVAGTHTYKVILQFNDNDSRIKAGMHAHARIITATHDNVLGVPASAIIQRRDNTVVLVQLSKGTVKEQTVATGITGANGFTEITAGLQPDTHIATFGLSQ
ncbi:MAG: efflux RND transporter periplasmic adaptor subunit [Patescibacteria group bacterium]|nr:efflux RND transporter periplasmic adaptor subunit [Patescibacteria group bacterium]MDE2437932.1 efflux RND transporter periplasmic adaptor subunit [Patescibacteria group bacterium]